ncbi:MAG: hypothetical protein AABY54_00155 [Deltaproteobacteria bacterium]
MLKKTLLLTLVLTILAGNAFALTAATAELNTDATGDYTIPGFKPSKSVYVVYQTDTTFVVYAIATKHTSGDKIYATDSATTKMFMKSGTAATALSTTDAGITIPTDATNSSLSGFTAM